MRRLPFARSGARLSGLVCFGIPLLAVAQTAPPQPSLPDAEILTQVQSVLRHESAFDGMTIDPTVAQGVVTLNGRVNSEAAKKLASSELGQITGIRTVLNNLAVTRPDGSPLDAGGATGPKVLTLGPGVVVPIRLTDLIDTHRAKVNDPFSGTVASNVLQDGYVAIASGAVVHGRVVDTKQAGRLTGSAHLKLELTSVELPTDHGSQTETLVTEPFSAQESGRGKTTATRTGTGAALGAVLGAIGGGGGGAAIGAATGGAIGAGGTAITRGKQVELRPEELIQFHLSQPLQVRIQLRGGEQVLPASADYPVLQARHVEGPQAVQPAGPQPLQPGGPQPVQPIQPLPQPRP